MSRSHKEVIAYFKQQSETLSQMVASFPEQETNTKNILEKLNIIESCISRAVHDVDRVQIQLAELEEIRNGPPHILACGATLISECHRPRGTPCRQVTRPSLRLAVSH